jgi:dihydroorotase/N-acyl-D-amino-acid deacylase
MVVLGATVADGSGGDLYESDVAIRDGTIVEVGHIGRGCGKREIDASGMLVSPGFIDSHSHSDISLLAQPNADAKLRQGVTTEIIGNCGWSVFPLKEPHREEFGVLARPILGEYDIDWSWKGLAGYFQRLERQGSAVNVGALVGHGAVRAMNLGLEDKVPSPRELELMRTDIQEAMDDGALGMSSGLSYPPGVYATTKEVAELASVCGDRGGIYATHLRDQVNDIEESVREALLIGELSHAAVLISHHKTVGKRNFGRIENSLRLVDAARSTGQSVWSDVYPYLAGSSTMLELLPPWACEGGPRAISMRLRDQGIRERLAVDFRKGLPKWENRIAAVGWSNVLIAHVGSQDNAYMIGLSVMSAAKRLMKSEVDLVCDLLIEEECNVGQITVNSVEEDLVAVLTHGCTVIGSDGMDVGDRPHPRLYGTFPRVLGRYVREMKALSLQSAIHKMTGQTANIFGLRDLGRIAPGYRADLVVLDPNGIQDLATYSDPKRFPSGILHVIVGGALAVSNGNSTGVLNGKVERRGL